MSTGRATRSQAATADGRPAANRGLTRHFRLGGLLLAPVLHAVDDLNLVIHEREIVALVGESGSGKTTVARLLAMIYPPTRGEIHLPRPLGAQAALAQGRPVVPR